MLPWFIWKEIINYAVYYDSEHCFVNKEWFKYGIGQFINLDSGMLRNNKVLPSWYKYAEDLILYTIVDINWDFLKECNYLTSIAFLNLNGSDENLNQLLSFISISKLKVLTLELSDKDKPDRALEILKITSKQLKVLEIDFGDSKKTYDEFLWLDYSSLSRLTVRRYVGLIDFNLIHQYMPNLRHLIFSLNHFVFKPIPVKKCLFSNLRTLVICRYDKSHNEDPNFIMGLFRGHFPNLLSLKLEPIIYYETFEKISQTMPKLKVLKFAMQFSDSKVLAFPIHLEELSIYSANTLDEEKIIQLDLAKVPQLHRLKIRSNIKLITSNKDFTPLIKYIHFTDDFSFPDQVIYDQLLSLNKIKVDCYKLNREFSELIKLCGRVTNLTLNNIRASIPTEFLSPGPFNTKHLVLSGWHFLTNIFIKWLAQQFELTNLTIEYRSDIIEKLDSISFPKLQELNFLSHNENDETYLKSIIKLDSTLDSNM